MKQCHLWHTLRIKNEHYYCSTKYHIFNDAELQDQCIRAIIFHSDTGSCDSTTLFFTNNHGLVTISTTQQEPSFLQDVSLADQSLRLDQSLIAESPAQPVDVSVYGDDKMQGLKAAFLQACRQNLVSLKVWIVCNQTFVLLEVCVSWKKTKGDKEGYGKNNDRSKQGHEKEVQDLLRS